MTNEEAIARIKEHKGIHKTNEPRAILISEALDMAIAALEKEIPKPISIENGFVKCGGCGMYIRLPIMDHYNNCPECGQKILWEGEEEC